METGDAGPDNETASSTEASCPVQDASQPASESQEALGDEAGSSCAATSMVTEGESILMTGEALDAAVMEIVALGYTKDQALVAMAASYNNPNRAVEYLLNPQFSQIRQTLASDPQLLGSFLQQVRHTNPRLHKVISDNRERFLQTLNEPIAADMGLGDLGGVGGGGGEAAVSGSIILSQAEHQAVERLMALGFSQSLCVQAYFACEKDDNLAADFLLSQDLDELN